MKAPTEDAELRLIAQRVEAIRLALTGLPWPIQGGILADTLATWLAGFDVEGDEDATHRLRAELLEAHCLEVRELTTVNAKIMGTTP